MNSNSNQLQVCFYHYQLVCQTQTFYYFGSRIVPLIFLTFQIFCKNRDKILKELKNKKIGVSVHYSNALPKMTYYKKKYNLNIGKFKNIIKFPDVQFMAIGE